MAVPTRGKGGVMKNTVQKTGIIIVLILISFCFLQPATADAAPLKLADYVTSYDIASPKLFWYSRPTCTVTKGAEDETDSEIIRRVPTYGGLFLWRTLYNENVGSVCTQQTLDVRSNLIADEEYVYWMSHSFGGLVRLSVNANEGDLPELLNDDVSGYSELAHKGDKIAVLTNADTQQIWVIDKTTGVGFRRIYDAGPNARNLQIQSDGRFLYWVTNGTLRRVTTSSGLAIITTLATGVTGYYPEGPSSYICSIMPLEFCDAEYVFIAQGDTVIRRNMKDNAVITVYTSTESSAVIYSLYSYPSSLLVSNGLYFLESRQESGGMFLNYRSHLIRTGRSSSSTVSHLHVTPSIAAVQRVADMLKSDGSHLFWEEQGGLWRLPMDADPVGNMQITGLEITQGIQDLDNSVKLIQNRRTFVRLYAESDDTPISGVTAYLYRVNLYGQIIGGPLVPVNPVGPQITVQTNPNRANLNDSFLFELPWSWVTSSLRLRASLNPNEIPVETTMTDNSSYHGFFYFDPSPRLEIQFVSWGYILNNTFYYPRLVDDVFQAYSWIRRVYPLASTPAGISDPSPGFRPNLWIVTDGELGSRVNRTHADCLAMDPDYRSLCASAYTNTMMDAMRDENGVPSSRFMYGMISDEAGFFPRGQACCGEKVSSGPVGTPNSGHWDDDTTYGDWYAAHEIGHTLGRGHPYQNSDDPNTEVREGCGHDPADYSYPYDGARIGPAHGMNDDMYGFDVGDPAFNLPFRVYPDVSWYDVMSYCPYEWISDYTYEAMYDSMMLSSASQGLSTKESESPSIAGDFLSVYGLIFPDRDSASINRLRRLSQVAVIPVYGEGYYLIRLMNDGGVVLAEYRFHPDPVVDFDEAALSFGQIVDFIPGTTRVQIYSTRSDRVLAEKRLSTHAPVISNVHVKVPYISPISGTITLEWDASDADSDPLTFDIFFSRDNGISFMPLQMQITGNSTQVDTEVLGGSSSAVFKVIASDGVNTAQGQTPALAIDNKPPDVFIVLPRNGLQIQYGQLVNFVGEAMDLQGDIAAADMVWSTPYTALGTGPALSVPDLRVGENFITFTATNSQGLSSSDSIVVHVNDDLALPGATLSVGPEKISWHVEAGSGDLKRSVITISNAGGGTLQWQASEDAPWLSVSAADGTAPATIRVTGDPGSLPENTVWSTILTIAATSPAGQSVNIPVSLSKGDVWRDTGNLGVGINDMASEFGRTDCRDSCEGDFDHDGDVDGSDIYLFIQETLR